jgi:hypothetical protein
MAMEIGAAPVYRGRRVFQTLRELIHTSGGGGRRQILVVILWLTHISTTG